MATDNTPQPESPAGQDNPLDRIPRRTPRTSSERPAAKAAASNSSRNALSAAAALALVVAGGVSALFLTIGPTGSAASEATTPATVAVAEPQTVATSPDVVIEYVDQYGNPLADPTQAADGGQANPTMDPALASAYAQQSAAAPMNEGEYEEDDEGEEAMGDDD